MRELKQLTDNLEKIITCFKDDLALHQKLSLALCNKNYKSKLNYGMEYGFEELICKVYPVWVLEQEVLFLVDILSENLIGLTSEKLQAEVAVIISEKVSSTVRNLMWWGIGKEDDFATVHNWCDVLKEIDCLPISAPCDVGRMKSLRSISKKKTELIRLWEVLFKCHHLGSKSSELVSKTEALDVFRSFSTNYPETTKIYGFSELIKAIELSAKRSKKAQRNDLIRKQIAITANVVSGRARTIICRTRLDNRKKGEAWITADNEHFKRLRRRRRSKGEVLKLRLNRWHENEKDFESILGMIFEVLIDEPENIGDKQQLIDIIRMIYQVKNNANEEPPWYPDFRVEPYFPNPDIVKCSHFLFVLGSLEQGNLEGRWEKESLQYLLKNQTQEGYWSSSTFGFRPDNYATVVAMHALGLWKPTGWKEAIVKAAEWLWKRQLPDGSWTVYIPSPLNRILLDAIDLAEGQLKLSLKSSNNAIVFVETERVCELEIERTPHIDTMNYGPAYSSHIDNVSIQEGFVFRPGQVFFMGKDLGIKTGMAQDILKKLNDNFGFVVAFKELENQSTDYEASVALRSIVSYLRKKLKQLPIQIDNRRQSGYIMQSPNIHIANW